MNKLEELQDSIAKLAEERDTIIAASRKAENAKLIGKCFRFSNSYGHGSRWWLYIKITGVDKNGWITVTKAQRCHHGRITIEQDSQFHMNDTYEAITPRAWRKAVDGILKSATKTLTA